MLGVSDGELESVELNIDMVNGENRVSPVLDALNLDIDGDTSSGNYDIGKTVVGKLGPSLLPPERKRYIPDVGLDLTEASSEPVVVDVHGPVDVGVGAELEPVHSFKLDDVGEEVRSREDEVLNDQVDLVIGVFCSWDGNVADLLDDSGEDDLSDIVPQLGLERQVALRVEEQVLGESLEIVAQSLVQRVIGQSGEPKLNLVKESLLVTLVLVGEESLAGLLEVGSFFRAVIIEDPSSLEQCSVSEIVDSGEPVPELRIVLSIGVDLVECIDHAIHGLAIGETLEESSETHGGVGDPWITGDILGGIGPLGSDVLSVASVAFQSIEKPSHSLHVVLVLLALAHDLRLCQH